MSQNSSVLRSCVVAEISGVLGVADDALGGVGGWEGMKKDGIEATLDCSFKLSFVKHALCMYTSEGLRVQTYDNGNIQNHIRNIARFRRPRRIDQLTQRSSKRIRQSRQCRRTDTSPIREPQITISRRRAETERLRQTDEDLAEHGEPKDPPAGSGAGISDPVPYE